MTKKLKYSELEARVAELEEIIINERTVSNQAIAKITTLYTTNVELYKNEKKLVAHIVKEVDNLELAK